MPLLSTQLCNSSCVYSGALTPRMLCAGYLDQRADACQVQAGGAPGRGGRGLRPGARLTSSPRAGAPRQVGSALRVEGARGKTGSVLEAGPPGMRCVLLAPGVGAGGLVCRHSTRKDWLTACFSVSRGLDAAGG